MVKCLAHVGVTLEHLLVGLCFRLLENIHHVSYNFPPPAASMRRSLSSGPRSHRHFLRLRGLDCLVVSSSLPKLAKALQDLGCLEYAQGWRIVCLAPSVSAAWRCAPTRSQKRGTRFFFFPNRNPSALFVSSWIVRTCSLHRRYSESVFPTNWRNCDLVRFRVDICMVSLRDAIVLGHWITVMVVRRV